MNKNNMIQTIVDSIEAMSSNLTEMISYLKFVIEINMLSAEELHEMLFIPVKAAQRSLKDLENLMTKELN